MAASRRQYQLKRQVSVTRAIQAKLCDQKYTAQRQLELKERELKFMKMLICKGENNNYELKEIIASKKVELDEMRGRLDDIEYEFSLARKKAKQLRDQLQQTTAVLAERLKNVQDIERAQANLERERNRFDTLLSTFAARTQVPVKK